MLIIGRLLSPVPFHHPAPYPTLYFCSVAWLTQPEGTVLLVVSPRQGNSPARPPQASHVPCRPPRLSAGLQLSLTGRPHDPSGTWNTRKQPLTGLYSCMWPFSPCPPHIPGRGHKRVYVLGSDEERALYLQPEVPLQTIKCQRLQHSPAPQQQVSPHHTAIVLWLLWPQCRPGVYEQEMHRAGTFLCLQK